MMVAWQNIQIWLLKAQIGTIRNALFYPKGDKGDYLKVTASIKVAILSLLLTAFLIAALITVFSELDSLLKLLIFTLTLVLSGPFLFLTLWAYKFRKQVINYSGLTEADIWELQNKTQAKLKALTDA